jgi:hypothetical protein
MKAAARLSFALAMLAGTLLWPPSAAQAIDYKDVLGAWCSQTAQLTFTREHMGVKWFADNQTAQYKIVKFEFEKETVEVYWVDFDNKQVSAVYGDFSADNKRMFLLQNPNAPRREYHRC